MVGNRKLVGRGREGGHRGRPQVGGRQDNLNCPLHRVYHIEDSLGNKKRLMDKYTL